MALRCSFSLLVALCVILFSAQPPQLAFVAAAAEATKPAADASAEHCDDADSATARKEAAKLRAAGDKAMLDKQYANAARLYSEAIRLEPSSETNHYKRYRAHDKMSDSKAALADLDRAVELNPEYTSAFAFRAKLLLSLGRCPDAARDYVKVLELKPSHGDAKKLLPKAHACAADVAEAEQLLARNAFAEAEQKLTDAMTVTDKAPYVKLLRARARFAQKKYYEAIADAGEVLKKDGNDQEALLLRGLGYYYVAEHDMALKHFQQGLQKDPEHAPTKDALKRLTRMLKFSRRGDEALARQNHQGLLDALEHFAQAVAEDPSHVEFVKTLHDKVCTVRAKLKQVPEARVACEAAIAADPERVEPYVTLADLLLRVAEETPDFEEAVRAWHRAQEVQRNNQQVHDGLQRAEAALRQSKQKNYYKILSVRRDADQAVIKKAYRRLAKDTHPDMHADKTEEEREVMVAKFQLVAEAYEVLSDAELRGKYDRGEEVFENQGNNGGQQRRHGFGFPGGFPGGFRFARRGP